MLATVCIVGPEREGWPDVEKWAKAMGAKDRGEWSMSRKSAVGLMANVALGLSACAGRPLKSHLTR